MRLVFIFTLVILMGRQPNLFAQNCCPEGIKFDYQHQIDSFPIKYPDCINILGDVHFAYPFPSEFIDDLSPLLGIKSIQGSLRLHSSWMKLDNLFGFDSLTTVNGDLLFTDTDGIRSLQGLNSLKHVGGDLRVIGFSCSGLENLTSFQGDIIIGGDSLKSLSNLNWPDTIKGSLQIYRSSLQNLNELKNVKIVLGDLSLGRNQSLINLDSIQTINSIQGEVFIWNNHRLKNINGFTKVVKELRIQNNDSLQTLEGFHGIENIGNLWIEENHSLKNLNGFRNLQSVVREVRIRNNDSLQNLSGLNSLNFIGTKLYIGLNKSMTTLSGLPKNGLTEMEYLSIWNNENLVSLEGLDSLNLMFLSKIWIKDNPNLNICGVNSICEYILNWGNIEIHNNDHQCSNIIDLEEYCGLKENNTNSKRITTLFPNPSSNLLHLKPKFYSSQGPGNFEIIEANGKKVLEGQILSGVIDISTIPVGIYFVKIQLLDSIEYFKFMKI